MFIFNELQNWLRFFLKFSFYINQDALRAFFYVDNPKSEPSSILKGDTYIFYPKNVFVRPQGQFLYRKIFKLTFIGKIDSIGEKLIFTI